MAAAAQLGGPRGHLAPCRLENRFVDYTWNIPPLAPARDEEYPEITVYVLGQGRPPARKLNFLPTKNTPQFFVPPLAAKPCGLNVQINPPLQTTAAKATTAFSAFSSSTK